MNWDWDKLQQNRQRGSNKGSSNNGNSQQPPFGKVDIGKFLPNFNSGIPLVPVFIVVLLLWLASGIFIVNPGEVGVVTLFGKYSRTETAGPNYRLPFPIEDNIIVSTQLRTVVIGQTAENSRFANQAKQDESSMFTGDENIVQMQFNVQYNVNGDQAAKYLFKVYDPDSMVAIAAEAAMREVVGSRAIDAILTADRAGVQIRAQEVLQKILNNYDCGINIHTVQLLDVQPPSEVAEAFKDVASAREDRVRYINEAEAYHNKIVPEAIGTAKSMINAAEAYRQQIVLGAEGEATRFLALATEFNKAKDITSTRLRLEAMNEILASPGIEKIVLSRDGKAGFLPFLNLDRQAGTPGTETTSGGRK